MRALASLALVGSSVVTTSLLIVLSVITANKPTRPLVGIYEAATSDHQRNHLDLEVLFLAWTDPNAVPTLRAFLGRSKQFNRIPMLTLEPFSDQAAGRGQADLLGDVLTGRHDQDIGAITHVLASHDGPILLRFGHEMDITGQYPWSFSKPSHYIDLYRYVYKKMTSRKTSNIHWVWSPAGKPQAGRFWPGGKYVDVIGVSIFASRAWMPDQSLQSFSEQLHEKSRFLRRFNRPVIVAEAGVSGTSSEQKRWINEAINSLPRFPEVCGFIYFQAPQPSWMPLPTGHENWELKPRPLRWLMHQLPLQPRNGRPCVES